jgi:hypothetical protein
MSGLEIAYVPEDCYWVVTCEETGDIKVYCPTKQQAEKYLEDNSGEEDNE